MVIHEKREQQKNFHGIHPINTSANLDANSMKEKKHEQNAYVSESNSQI